MKTKPTVKSMKIFDVSVKRRANKKTKQLANWIAIPESDLRFIWSELDDSGEMTIAPPVRIPWSSRMQAAYAGMRYLRAEIKEDPEASANRKARSIVSEIYDLLFYDTERDRYNPVKKWDGAADYLEEIARIITNHVPEPKNGSSNMPEYIKE